MVLFGLLLLGWWFLILYGRIPWCRDIDDLLVMRLFGCIGLLVVVVLILLLYVLVLMFVGVVYWFELVWCFG